jgi:hypothetical protein
MLTDAKGNGGLDLSKMLNINQLAGAVSQQTRSSPAIEDVPSTNMESSLIEKQGDGRGPEAQCQEAQGQEEGLQLQGHQTQGPKGEEYIVASENSDSPLTQVSPQIDLSQLAKGLEGFNPEQMIQGLLKSVPPEFQNLFSQMMKPAEEQVQQVQEQKSLIDFEN